MSGGAFPLRTALSQNVRVCFPESSTKMHSHRPRFILRGTAVLGPFPDLCPRFPVLFSPQEAASVGSLALWLPAGLARGEN